MNTSTRSPVRGEMEQVKEHRGNPGVDAVPEEFCPSEQPPPGDPDEGAFETFVDGGGI